jgi:AsmA protein
MKASAKTLLAAVGLLVVAVAITPFLIDANTFRPQLEKQLTAALGRQVKLGNLSLAILSGSLVASGLTIADEPKYSMSPFLTTAQLRIAVAMRPLIFSRRLLVRRFIVVEPYIHLVRQMDGSWNFSSIGRNRAGRTENDSLNSVLPDLAVSQIAVEDGRAVVESASATEPPLVYQHLNLSAQQFSFAKRFSFRLSANLPGDGAVIATGNAGPVNEHDAAMTAVDAQVWVRHLEPVAAGLLNPNVGVSMIADIDARAISDGRTLTSAGTIRMDHLQLGKSGRPAPNSIDLSYDVTHGLKDDTGELRYAIVNAGNVALHMSGTYQLRTSNPLVDLKLAGRNLSIDELQTFINAAGLKLPNGAVLKGGTMDTRLAIKGRASALLVAGAVEINGTKMVGFDLGSKLHGIAALSGVKTGDTTDFEKLRLTLQTTNAGTKLDDIYALIPAMGELTGSGTVSPASELNLHLTAKVSAPAGIGKPGVALLTKLNEFAGSDGKVAGAKGVPMVVEGTADDPVIMTDVRGLLHRDEAALLSHFRKKK